MEVEPAEARLEAGQAVQDAEASAAQVLAAHCEHARPLFVPALTDPASQATHANGWSAAVATYPGSQRQASRVVSAEVPVLYRDLLPDLFREGQGVVAEGALNPDGVFMARQVLAKHDENYMPPEVAEALKKSGQWQGAAETE